MIIVRGLAVAALVAGAAGVAASPAHAQGDPMAGVYTFNQPGQPPGTWEISPTCVPAGCMLHVAMPEPRPSKPGGNANLVNDRWTFGMYDPEGFTCPDGSKAPLKTIYSWDSTTLTGTASAMHSQQCGSEPGITRQPFTLTYVRPLNMPVELYPLMCPTWPHCEENTIIPGTLGDTVVPSG